MSKLIASISSVEVRPNLEFIPPLFAHMPLPELCSLMRSPMKGFGANRSLAVSMMVSSSFSPSIVRVTLCPISAAMKPIFISSLSLKPFTVIGAPYLLYAIASSSSGLLPASSPYP